MVEFIELSDSDESSYENRYSLVESNGRKRKRLSDPIKDGSREPKPLLDGKSVLFWESFPFAGRICNDDESIHDSSSSSSSQRAALSSVFPEKTVDAPMFHECEETIAQSDVDGSSDDESEGSCDERRSAFSCSSEVNLIDEDKSKNEDGVIDLDEDQASAEEFHEVAVTGDDIMSKHGNRNFGADPNVSFSYASSKLFNNIAKSSSTVDNRSSGQTCDRNPYVKRKPFEKKNKNNWSLTQPKTGIISVSDEKYRHEYKTIDGSPHKEVHDLWQRNLEIDPEWCKPPSLSDCKEKPVVHYLNSQTRPLERRHLIPVDHLFGDPFVNFWRCKFHSFNELQSELASHIMNNDKSIVVSAPTAAGKTCIFEMAICRLLAQSLESFDMAEIPKCKKILYIAPNKALCEERYDDWCRRFRITNLPIEVALVTGDSGFQSFTHISSAHLILTTPEKWDSITRRWTERFFLISSIKLLLIDEVHMLGDEQRGPCLESLICRMKTVQRAAQSKALSTTHLVERNASHSHDKPVSNMRIVAVSATLPNICDIAAFLDVQEAFSFDESYRPVSLKVHVVGLGYKGKNQYLFDKNLDQHVPDLLDRFSDGKPAIVFCHSKKETERLAADISSRLRSSNHSVLLEVSKTVTSGVLQRCMKLGVAFHHAGMETDNRRIVEQAFANGLLKCLCATSTLAVGVNLPAHLVIIKGTSAYRGASIGHVEIDLGTILQMIGRAGRPGFDTSGTAVIMTDAKSKCRYEKLSSGLETVESFLLSQLTETLNSEVSQQVITTVQRAIDWLKGTFFYNCIRRNPEHYGLSKKSEKEREEYLMKHCLESLQKLHNAKIIRIQDNMMCLTAENASHVMNHHMVPFESMKLIIGLPYDSGPLQLLQTLSKMKGLHFPVRKSEKTLLNQSHKEMKFKLEGPLSKVRINTSEEKAFVLLQAAIGQYYYEDYTLRQEMSVIVEYSKRMLAAIEEFSVNCSKHGAVALESFLLKRSLNTSLWGPDDGVLNQIKGVGPKCGKKLTENNIKSFADVLSRSSNEIEQACGRSSPFGQELRASVTQIFRNSLSLSACIQNEQVEQQSLKCTLKHRKDIDQGSVRLADERGLVSYTLSVHVDGPGNLLMFRQDICDEGVHSIVCPKSFGRLYIRLVCNIVGMDEQLTIDGGGTISRSLFSVSPKMVKGKGINQTVDRAQRVEMDKLVDGIEDVRVHKRKITVVDETKNCPLTLQQCPTQVEFSEKASQLQNYSELHKRREVQHNCEVVTPSPKIQPVSGTAADKRASMDNFSQSINRSDTHSATRLSSWAKEKCNQQHLQKRVFKSERDNPFSSYMCDPNNLELQMESQSNDGSSVAMGGRFSSVPRPNPLSAALRRKRLHRTTARLPNQDLLRMKAQEQQFYASAHVVAPSHATFNQPIVCPVPGWTSVQPVHNNHLYLGLENSSDATSYHYAAFAPSVRPPINLSIAPAANLFAQVPWVPQTHDYTFDNFSSMHLTGDPFYGNEVNPNNNHGPYGFMQQLAGGYPKSCHWQCRNIDTLQNDSNITSVPSNIHCQLRNYLQPPSMHALEKNSDHLGDCTKSLESNGYLFQKEDAHYSESKDTANFLSSANSVPHSIKMPGIPLPFQSGLCFQDSQRFEDAFF